MGALINKTTYKLMNVLFDNPLKEFKEIELIEKAKTGKGSASKILSELAEKDIVLEKRVGKTKIISLNLRNKKTFLLKNLFDQEKIKNIDNSKLTAILFFKEKIKDFADLMIVFGSSIAGTSDEKSDIDVFIVSKKFEEVERERKFVEELFGERFNIHSCSHDEVVKNFKTDLFMQNILLKGIILFGLDFGIELFSYIYEKQNLEKLLFFIERIRSSLRNYFNNDKKASESIINATTEQLIFYLLSEKKIPYLSKKDAEEIIKTTIEGKTLQDISKNSLKERILKMERFIIDVLKNKILKDESYANR